MIDHIRRLARGLVRRDVFMRDLTSFRIGGAADVVVDPCDVEDMAALRSFLSREGLPHLVMGAGTNLLCSDKGYRGVVVRTSGLRRMETMTNGSAAVRIAAGAGAGLTGLTTRAHRAGGRGMEPLWGIPGSVGGGVAGNAGAGEVETCDFLEELTLVTHDGTVVARKRDDLEFDYRRGGLPPDAAVVEGIFRFELGDPREGRERLRYWMRVRRERQPWRARSAGCIFKNPDQGDPAGAMIDRLGFKGIAAGGAQVSAVHANFIINTGGATAEDVLTLIRRIRRRVADEYHIRLALEIKLIGEGLEHADPW
ncbi:MAG: UDP-N-acetylmuramate dehydrogenase [Desulfomonilaceae bacterium]